MTKVPKRLTQDPIVDCIAEIQFEAADGSPAIGEVLPGLLFSAFRKTYPQSQPTSESEIPRNLRMQNPQLRKRPTIRLMGDDGFIGIGEESVQVFFARPYPGWGVVKPRVISVFHEVLQTQLISEVSRLSIKYRNLLDTGETDVDLSPLDLTLRIGKKLKLRGPGTLIRSEFEIDQTTTIFEVQSGANVERRENDKVVEKMSGLLVSIDTIYFGNVTGVKAIEDKLELVHTTEKQVFFDVISDETLEALKPEWD